MLRKIYDDTRLPREIKKITEQKNALKPVSDLVVMVVDYGLFIETAITLAKAYKKVYYYTPNYCAFPKMNTSFIGYGFPEIEVVETMYIDDFDKIDLFIFLDIGFGSIQTYLEKIGKKVWGSRMGEKLESHREFLKGVLKDAGLPVGDFDVVKGIDALRSYLKTNKDVYVKMSKWRGTFESFYSPEYKIIEPKLDDIENVLGGFKYISEFVVEKSLPDKVEIGVDLYTVDGVYPKTCLGGIEIKDQGYMAAIKEYKDFPKPLIDVNDGLSKEFKKFGYRGLFSTEVRIGSDLKPFLIDFTARQGSPPGELYQEMYSNLADIFWSGANGICIDPIPAGKFGVQINLHSSWAEKNWQPVDFPKENRRFIKLHNVAFINGKHYVIPMDYGLDKIGAVIGFGDTMEEAEKNAKEVGKSIEGYEIKMCDSVIEKAKVELEKSEKLGLKII